MPALDTVAKVTAYARVLLQDTLEPYRYPDADLLAALNTGLMDARRLRPDLFLSSPKVTPSYEIVDNTVIAIDQQYRMALVYFVIGQAQLRDEEDVTDARAASFLAKFAEMMISPLTPQGIR